MPTRRNRNTTQNRWRQGQASVTAIPVTMPPIPTLPMHTACTCPCSIWMSCFLAGVQICKSLFSLLSWDTAYLFLLSCSLPRSSATILIPTSLGVLLAKHVHTLGDQPDGMGGLPPYLEWQLNVDPPMLCNFQHHIPHSIPSTPTTPLLHTAPLL